MRDYDDIIAMYQNGHSTKEIANKHGISQRGVRYILNQRGITLQGRRRTNGYKVNDDFFKTWTIEMAYVLGFIFTDGNVSGSTLTIAQNERYILESIRDVMESDNRITEGENGKNIIHTLRVHRKEIVEDLRKMGVTEGKSRIMTFPEVPTEYLPHFIRGIIDGDGWVQDRGYVMNVTNASEPFSYVLHDVFNSRG